jgi:hypothetical protein
MAVTPRLLELLLVPSHACCRARWQRLLSIAARRHNRHWSASSAGRHCRWPPSSRRPGRWWPWRSSEHLLTLGFTDAVSATRRKNGSIDGCRVEREYEWKRASTPSPLFPGSFMGAPREPTMMLYPGFFAHRTIFGFSWRQPKEADIGKLVTNPRTIPNVSETWLSLVSHIQTKNPN